MHTTPAKTKTTTARTKTHEPLTLPFWDDFSFTPVNIPDHPFSNHPIDSLWENSFDVLINEGIGIKPPSINVATFDGLDSTGLPYSDQLLANGFRDNLTSRPINLSDPAINRSTVYLSFFYQWQGNGEAPDKNDYLRVEFKNSKEEWEPVMTILPKVSFKRDLFYDTIVQVNGDQFFHGKFQFRFRNYGRLSGPFDTWNIDYVYLNKNRNSNERFFPDGTFASTVTSIFGPYTSVPLHHFRKSPIVTPATVDVFNLRGGLVSYNYRAFAEFKNFNGDTETTHHETLVYSRGIGTNPDGSASGAIDAMDRVKVQLYKSPNPGNESQFRPDAESTQVKLKFQLLSNDVIDTLGNPATDYAPYDPADFRLNDTISAIYHLKDYYAYDDGTAEYAVTLNEAGDLAAYLFEMLSPNPDTLIGFDIYLPLYGVKGSITADFYIYNEVNGEPKNVLYSIPSRAIKQTGLNEFQTIRMEPLLVERKFFIGWKAPVGELLRVGLDLNNDSGDKIFVDTNGKWEKNTDVQGSLMIRPRFGGGEIITGIPKEKSVAVFPNPNRGEFFITGSIDHLEIISTAGQRISFTTEQQHDRSMISLTNAPAGLYVLRITHGKLVSTQKIMVH